MTAIRALRAEIVRVGYENAAVVDDYAYSDVFVESSRERRIALAAFTQVPPSYRNAAMGVIEHDDRDAETIIAEHRALGAPLLFLISGQIVTAWQVRAQAPPRAIARAQLSALPTLFAQHRDDWSPLAIHRAKSIGAIDRSYQLDFVDAGLLPLVEGQVHLKLDRLIGQTLAETAEIYRTHAGTQVNHRVLFRAMFRLLAAKVLQDRGHVLSGKWDADDLASVITSIGHYYKLPRLPELRADTHKRVFATAWNQLRRGINFRNISSDDLAFVYEHTLITPETRKHFGTHSTPRQVAEYVVSRLEFWRSSPAVLNIYEPFAGAGVFLVAALRHLRELLPPQWTDRHRHEFLVKRLAGDEVDAFACEVATLSLILADYPNANGWNVSEHDLFKANTLVQRAGQARITLCNPPFETFTIEERAKYPEMARRSLNKSAAVLNAILDANPIALGFVLPRAFLDEKQFQKERQRVARLFSDIELVALPEGTFKHSTMESAVLIARSPRARATTSRTNLRSSVVKLRDRDKFLQAGQVTESRFVTRSNPSASGDLWIRELDELWRYLEQHPKLGDAVEIHRGIEWREHQSRAVNLTRLPGYRRGLHNADSVRAFVVARPVWLDTRPERLRARAIELPWDKPKVVVNAVRLSRGSWRLAAAVDSAGLVASQQLFGCWLRAGAKVSLSAVAGILNSPIANAFVTVHSPAKGIRVSTMQAIPMPREVPSQLAALVTEYVAQLSAATLKLGTLAHQEAIALLSRIDALILQAYDLPPKVERDLLEFFRGAARPTVHPWKHWFPPEFQLAVPLDEYLSGDYAKAASNWVLDVFKPLTEVDAAIIRDYME